MVFFILRLILPAKQAKSLRNVIVCSAWFAGLILPTINDR